MWFLAVMFYCTLVSAVIYVCIEMPWLSSEKLLFSSILRPRSPAQRASVEEAKKWDFYLPSFPSKGVPVSPKCTDLTGKWFFCVMIPPSQSQSLCPEKLFVKCEFQTNMLLAFYLNRNCTIFLFQSMNCSSHKRICTSFLQRRPKNSWFLPFLTSNIHKAKNRWYFQKEDC